MREREREKKKRKEKSAHTQERESEKKHFGSSFYTFFPLPGSALCKLGLGRSAVCSAWSLHSGPRTFLWPCLLVTAILDSFSLFYLPNIPPSRDGRPNSLGIGGSRSFWLLPAELGWWGVLGLPLLLVSILRVLIVVSKGVWYFPWSAVVLYLCWTGTACCSWLTWAEIRQVRQLTVHGISISIISIA